MVVGILLVLDNLLWVLLSDLALAHLLADSRVELTHLTALSYWVATLVQVLRSFDGSSACAGPDTQRLRGCGFWCAILDQVLAF